MLPLAQDQPRPRHRRLDRGMEGGAGRALDAMIRPQHLLAIRHPHRLERRPAGMAAGERAVAGGMPVLRHHDMREARGEVGDRRHHRVPVRHREPAAGTEVNLRIDDDEGICRGDVAGVHAASYRPNGTPAKHDRAMSASTPAFARWRGLAVAVTAGRGS